MGLALVVACGAASAAVDHIDITSRTSVMGGRAFGVAGPFEKIVGRVYFKVKPGEPHNRVIVDLDKAEKSADGDVVFSSDFWLLHPLDPDKANGGLLLEIPNRGHKNLLADINGAVPSADPTKEKEYGDRWLLRQGYTFAVLGWQWDLAEAPGIMRLSAPVAHEADGKPITGLLRDDFTLPTKTTSLPLGHILLGSVGGVEYPVSNPDDPRNVLTVRDGPTAERQIIPREEWSFAREENYTEAGKRGRRTVPDTNHILLKKGFEPGKLYELVYVVQDPVVAGLGLAAVRDFVSYLKNDKNDIATVSRAYAIGISQSGRFLRHFLYQNFNADEQGRQVFDGITAIVAGAGRGSFNHRFAQPSRDAAPLSAVFYPTDLFPFTDLPERDPVTGEKAGLLDAAQAAHVVPKIFYVNTSYEYWGRAASLIHTTPDGTKDADLAPNTRIYFFAGLEHFPGRFPPGPRGSGIADLQGQYPANPNPDRWLKRALIMNMNGWVRDGVEPPPSKYPKISDGTLVALNQVKFPEIPETHFPTEASVAWRLDFGSSWKDGIISTQPPKVGAEFPVLLPQVDADGNELAGVHIPEMTVPLATYTGWNYRAPTIGAPDRRLPFIGSYFPFRTTPEEREKSGDPRKSIGERYESEEAYVTQFRDAASALMAAHWMIREDLIPVLTRGQNEWQAVQAADAASAVPQ